MTTDDWQGLIPNRDPWLWIDEVLELTDTTIHARKHLSESLPVFQGHYPGFPLLPGVILCEACLEASAILIADLGVSTEGRVPVATRMNNVKFRRMVRPGETIGIQVSLRDRLQDVFYLSGRVEVAGDVAATLDFVTTAVPPPEAHVQG